MERQGVALFGGVRMVGSCFISNPALASITKRKSPPTLSREAGFLSIRFGTVRSGLLGVSVQKLAAGRRGSAHGRRPFDVREEAEALFFGAARR